MRFKMTTEIIASTLSLLTNVLLVVVSTGVVNAACQPASREYQMHQGNILAFYPSPIQDHVLKDTIYQMRKASSDVMCAVYCLQDESCKSFNYCNDKICHLKTANYSLKGSEVQLSAECVHYGEEELQIEASTAAPGDTHLPCVRNYTTETAWNQVEEPLDLPMRLEFSVQGPMNAALHFSPGTRSFLNGGFYIVMNSSHFAIQLQDDQSFTIVKAQHAPKIFGKPVFVTYNNGHIEAGVRDSETSHMTFDLPSPPQADRMFIVLLNPNETEWSFFEPCTQFNITSF